MKTKKIIFPLIISLLLVSCGRNNTVENNGSNGQETVSAQLTKVSTREVEQSGTFNAIVQAETTNNIAPQSSMRIKKIYAEVGDHVRAGQKLADMDALNLNQTKLQMENDKLEFERIERLYQAGGTSRSSWDSKKLAHELSRQSYENLLENTTLVSPIDGIVTKRNYDNGDMYSMGSPIFVVEQIRPVKIMVGVSESLFTKVKKEMEVDIKLDVYGDEVFKGKVNLVHPSIDSDTHTFQVEVQINNQDERIRPGMFARVTFTYGTENHIVVSDRAIQKQAGSGERFVYVIENGIAQYRKIELGQRINDEYEIISGLNDGEMVALTAQSRMSTGTKVEASSSPSKEGDVSQANASTTSKSDNVF